MHLIAYHLTLPVQLFAALGPLGAAVKGHNKTDEMFSLLWL